MTLNYNIFFFFFFCCTSDKLGSDLYSGGGNSDNCFAKRSCAGKQIRCNSYLLFFLKWWKTFEVYPLALREWIYFQGKQLCQICFCPLVRRDVLNKARICSLWEQSLALQSRHLFRRKFLCRKSTEVRNSLVKNVSKISRCIHSP